MPTLIELREAPWVTEMRAHFQKHGYYRREDLARVLGSPGDSVNIGPDGTVVYRRARASQQTTEG